VQSSAPRFALLAVAPCALALALALGPDPVRLSAAQPLISRAGNYVGSSACRTCHPDQHASWARTYHRTMTQRPSPASVLGRFDGEAREFYGRSATPFERDGRYFMRVPTADGDERQAEWRERLAFLQNAVGAIAGPFDSFLALRGVKTLALRMEQGVTVVYFIVGADGRLSEGPRVVKSSGFDEFDLAAVRAVRQAAPFPTMPFMIPMSMSVIFDNPVIR